MVDSPNEFIRKLLGWLLLAGFSGFMFATLLYWWLRYHMGLWLDGPVIVANIEPNTPILISELILLPAIAIWATVEAILTVRNMVAGK